MFSEKINLKKVTKNPGNLNYVERLTLYTLLQVIYVHVKMVCQAFNENLIVGKLSKAPQDVFGHFPKWVDGEEGGEDVDVVKMDVVEHVSKKSKKSSKKRKNGVEGMEWRVVKDNKMEIDEL